jgi:hypothetical protein
MQSENTVSGDDTPAIHGHNNGAQRVRRGSGGFDLR